MQAATPSKSRFATGVNPHGLQVSADVQPLAHYEALLAERDADGEPSVQPVELVLKRIAVVEGGGLALVDIRQPFAFIPSARTAISGKFHKREKRGWVFLDAFFSGDQEWHESRDQDVWSAALEAAQDVSLGSEPRSAATPPLTRALWFLNRLIAVALVHRRGGIGVGVADLPTV